MLEELLKYDKLGNKEELLFVLFDAFSTSKKQRKDHLKKYCTSHRFSIGNSLSGILKLLEFISFISVSDDIISVETKVFSPEKNTANTYFETLEFVTCLLNALKNENALGNFFNRDAIKFNAETQRFYVKENFIPYSYYPIRNLLLSIGYFERDLAISGNHLLIKANFNDSFNELVIEHLIISQEKFPKKKMTLEQLKNSLRKKNEIGNKAEDYVQEFEKIRLQGHPLLSKIIRISEEFVNAGYDIESYNDKESVIIDRYIEVKSFEGEVSFFWSKNEVSTAKRLKEKYFLYLVDRSKCEDSGYKPSIFQNPYEKIFENEIWRKEAENWQIELEE